MSFYIFVDFADLNNSAGVFTHDVAKSLTSDHTFQDIILETRELAYVELKLLNSHEELLCFYGNLINLFTIHTLLHCIGAKQLKVLLIQCNVVSSSILFKVLYFNHK